LPLALAIAAARAQLTGFPLARIAAELTDARQRLDALDAGDPPSQVRSVFSWSYTALSPLAARLFRLLGLHPGPDLSVAAAASLAATPLAETSRMLAELARANLLTEHRPGRYTLHDLLRAYTAEMTGSTDPERDRREALTRLFDHYVHTAHAADRLLTPSREPVPVPLSGPAEGTTTGDLTGYEQADAWLTAERPVLLAATQQAADQGFDTHVVLLAWSLDTFLNRQGLWLERDAAWQTALEPAGRVGDEAAEAYVHRRLANAGARLGRNDLARHHGEQALDLSGRIGDRISEAHAHIGLAMVLQREGRLRDALDHAQQALHRFAHAGHRFGAASAHNAIGWCHAELGDGAEAVSHCEQAVAGFRDLGDRSGQAYAFDSLGYAYHRLGRYGLAADSYRRALDLQRELGDRDMQADTLIHLGDSLVDGGDAEAARAAWREALDLLTGLDRPQAAEIRAKLDAADHAEDFR
jgi:tetratricopeptide (TPR) repeat protein